MRLLIISFFFVQGNLFAQDFASHSQIEKLGLPLDVDHGIDDSWRNERSWALKLSPFHAAVGDFALYYEQRLGKHTSIEFGAGATISGVKNMFQHSQPIIQPYYDILPYDWQYQHVSDGGFLGALEFRIYPIAATNSMRSLYIAPAVKYKRYNYGVRDYSGYLPNYKGNDQHFNGYLNCGFQFWPNRKFVIDVFLGAGLGYHTTESAIQDYTYVNGTYEGNWRKVTSNELVFLLNTGVKFGIGGGRSAKKKQVVAE